MAATQEIAGYLRSRGHNVAAYSGQTETTERSILEEDLAAGRVKALIATSALGMGFDSTLGFVVNMGAPQSPVAYYQQVGRAGRGTDEATVVLLPAIEDRDIWAYFASLAFPREELVRQTLETLATEGKLATPALETRVELSRNRLETMLKVLDVDGAVRRVRGGWEATGEPWSYDAERYERVREAREREQRAMLDYLDTGGCRMRFLREQLDDPEAADCGRCDNCGGLSLDATVSKAAVEEAGTALSRPGVPIEPRKMWPTALATMGIDLKGKIQEPAEEGRAIARLTDLGHGQALRALFRPDTPDGPVPTPLVQAVLHAARRLAPRGRRDRGGGVDDEADPHRGPRPRAVPPAPGAGGRALGDRRPRRRAEPGRGQLRPAGRRGRAPVDARGRHTRRRADPPRRRPGRHRLDPHPRRPRDPRGRRVRGAAAHAGGPELTGTFASMTKVAVLGTGKMGAGMARQLVQHGHTVTVWNRNRDRAAPLAEDGATVAGEPSEAVRGADVVVVVLFDADSVVDVLRAAGPGMTEQTVVVQTSTVGLDIDRVAEETGRLGVRLLDAPVLGTRQPAEQGTLTVLASGDPALREIADPVLDAIGARTVWAGDEVGAASRLKLVCNAFTGAQTAGPPSRSPWPRGSGSTRSCSSTPSLVARPTRRSPGPRAAMMISGDYPPAFDVEGMRKDLALILAGAEEAGIATELARALLTIAERAEERGHGGDDMAAVRAAF